MIRHTITIPEAMDEYIAGQMDNRQYGNVSEFFRDLVRRDQERRQNAILELRKLIEEAEASGISNMSMDDIRNEVRDELKL